MCSWPYPECDSCSWYDSLDECTRHGGCILHEYDWIDDEVDSIYGPDEVWDDGPDVYSL